MKRAYRPNRTANYHRSNGNKLIHLNSSSKTYSKFKQNSQRQKTVAHFPSTRRVLTSLPMLLSLWSSKTFKNKKALKFKSNVITCTWLEWYLSTSIQKDAKYRLNNGTRWSINKIYPFSLKKTSTFPFSKAYTFQSEKKSGNCFPILQKWKNKIKNLSKNWVMIKQLRKNNFQLLIRTFHEVSTLLNFCLSCVTFLSHMWTLVAGNTLREWIWLPGQFLKC